MNPVNLKKILNSKWTAVTPQHKEKHFIVTKCLETETDRLEQVELEAIYTRRVYTIHWQELKDDGKWRVG